jgi:dihydrofolate reductase
MRLVVTQNSTLDGVVEMVTDWFSPQGGANDDAELTAELRKMMAAEDAQLLGRVTFESFREYWPKQTDDKTGVSDHLNRVRKLVVSQTLKDPAWENTTVVSKPGVEAVKALKAQPGGNIGVTGSIMLCHALIEAGLVDEYRLFVYPVVLGRGRRLFRDGLHVESLTLTHAKRFANGVAMLTYERR